MLMCPHDGAVEHGVLIVRVCGQHLEHLFPYAALRPTRKPRVNLDRIAKTFRQVAPRYACAITVKYRLDEQPVILGCDADIAFGRAKYP